MTLKILGIVRKLCVDSIESVVIHRGFENTIVVVPSHTNPESGEGTWNADIGSYLFQTHLAQSPPPYTTSTITIIQCSQECLYFVFILDFLLDYILQILLLYLSWGTKPIRPGYREIKHFVPSRAAHYLFLFLTGSRP